MTGIPIELEFELGHTLKCKKLNKKLFILFIKMLQLPFRINPEKPVYQSGSNRIGIELAHTSN
jgi:hypothetical protein